MNYPLRIKPKRNPSFRRAFLVVCAMFVFMGFLFLLNSKAPFSLFATIGRPFWGIKKTTSALFSSNTGFFKSKKTLVDDNASLKRALLDLTVASLERDVLREENKELKTVREGFQKPARVLATPAHALYDLMIIEVSKDSQAKPGDLVFAQGVVLLGEILDRDTSTARVRLFSSPGTLTTMRLVSSGTELSLLGQGGGNFSVLVPSSLYVQVGDIFSIPSFTTNLVSRVGSVVPAQIDSFNNVLSSYPVNIFEISWVGILHEQ